MIGRPDWFAARRYAGIGLRPKTWQGWVYIAVVLILFLFIRWQPFWDWSNQIKNILTIAWAFILVIDAIHITYMLNKNRNIRTRLGYMEHFS